MLLGTAVALAAAPLYWYLGRRYGAEGVAAAGAIAMSANAVALLLLLRRVHGGPPVAPLLSSFGRALVLALVLGLAASWAASLFESALGATLAGGAILGILAIPGIWLLGDEEMREVLKRLGARLRGGRRD